MWAIVATLTALLIVLSGNPCTAADVDDGTQSKLAQLEQRFFGRIFDADTEAGRTIRLEKLILGEPAEGAIDQRVQKLFAETTNSSDVGTENQRYPGNKEDRAVQKKSAVESLPSKTGSMRRSAAPAPEQGAPGSGGSDVADDTSVLDKGDYPRVTALENVILQRSYVGQPLGDRLGRMEIAVFGNRSNSSDFSQRTDALDQYAEQHLHKKVVQGDSDAESTGTTGGASMRDRADYPRVSALENVILGQSYAGQPLEDRLSRMEATVFGSHSTNPDMSQRTDALEKYVEKTMHKKLVTEQTNADSTAATSPQQEGGTKQLLSKVGRSLLSMAGVGTGADGVTSGGMSVGGGGMGFGGLGLGSPGMGMGGPGMRRGPRQQQEEPPKPEVETPQDDPAVYQPSPPAPDTKLLVKVGWCEVQLFGHTFPNMHLPERLGQLNDELHFKPGKPNIQLMDDIGALIKTVQAQKQPLGSIKPKPPPSAVH